MKKLIWKKVDVITFRFQKTITRKYNVVKSTMMQRHSMSSFLSPDDDLLKPKCYNVDFLSHYFLHFGLLFYSFLHIVGFFSVIYFHTHTHTHTHIHKHTHTYIYIYVCVCVCVCVFEDTSIFNYIGKLKIETHEYWFNISYYLKSDTEKIW